MGISMANDTTLSKVILERLWITAVSLRPQYLIFFLKYLESFDLS